MNKPDIVSVPERRLQYRLKRLAGIFSVIVSLIGLSVLCGWAFNIEYLKRPLQHLVAMNPMTAACFLLLGIAIFLESLQRDAKKYRVLVTSILLAVGAVGILRFLAVIFSLGLNVDHLIFPGIMNADAAGNVSNHMAPNTAFNLMLSAVSLFLVDSHSNKKIFVAHVLSIFIAFIAIFSILGYLYHVKEFYGILSYLPMSLHTAVTFLFVSFCILFLEPDKGMMTNITGSYSGSIGARVLLIAAIIIPFIFGLAVLGFYWAGLLNAEFAMAILVLSIMAVFFSLVWHTTVSLNKKDMQRTLAEHKLMERTRELANAVEELQKTNRSLEQFTYVASHDLQEPLRKINTFGDMLGAKFSAALGKDGADYISRMQSASARMSSLINNLLAYTRLSEDEIKYERVDMNALIAEIISDMEVVITDKKAVITVGNLLPVNGDSVQLRQLFQNLISNSMKFMERGKVPVLHISSTIIDRKEMELPLREDGVAQYQQIAVQDNGIGFEKEYSEKIFTPFQRLHTTKEYPGTGIGLSIVKKAVDNHNGYVMTNSKPGEGTLFSLLFPLMEA